MSESTGASKLCLRCGTVKPVSEFYRQAAAKDGLQHRCRECSKDSARQHYWGNRDRHLGNMLAYRNRVPASVRKPPEGRKRSLLKNTFKMTHAQYIEMFNAQGGACTLCGEPETHVSNKSGRTRWLSVDHDHRCCPGSTRTCGQCVRGLLCHRCNLGIGKLRDDPTLLRRAADYIDKYRVD